MARTPKRNIQTATPIASTTGLLWHGASTAIGPAVAGASGLQHGDCKESLIVMSDAHALAQDVLKIYRSLLERHDSLALAGRHESNRHDCSDIAVRLSNAIEAALEQITQTQRGEADILPDNSVLRGGRQREPAIVAIVVRENRLVVARHGGGRVHLLRNGRLQALMDDAFLDGAMTPAYAPAASPQTQEIVLGELELHNDDRIFLCNEAMQRHVGEGQIKAALRSSPSARRTAEMLIATAALSTRSSKDEVASLAVADFVASPSNEPRGAAFARQARASIVAESSPRSSLRPMVTAAVLIGAIALVCTLGMMLTLNWGEWGGGRVTASTGATPVATPAVHYAVLASTETALDAPTVESLSTATLIAAMSAPTTTSAATPGATSGATSVPTLAADVISSHAPTSSPSVQQTIPLAGDESSQEPLPMPSASVLARIDLSPSNALVGLNGSLLITATVYDALGGVGSEGQVSWSSSSSNEVLSLGNRVILFSGTVAGVHVVTATLDGVNSSAIVVVDKDWRTQAVDLSFPSATP